MNRTAATLATVVAAWLAMPARAEEPTRARLFETTTVTLVLLDVEVTDKAGRPIRGLKKEDFAVRTNGRLWTIESVDDLCPCTGQDHGKPRALLESSAKPAAEPGGEPAAEPARFILYLDFSQIQSDGRTRAIQEARRWLSQMMRPQDQVMIAVYATASGSKTLCPFTNDRARLIAALEQASADPLLNDPFPTSYFFREKECKEFPLVCPVNVADEYHHGRRSFDSLRRLIVGLETTPGRKQLILFTQNGNISPGALYGRRSFDHRHRMEEVVAEATTSRVTINTAMVGDSQFFDVTSAAAVELGFYLADATGGLYNRASGDLSRILDDTRQRCACVYRIGLQPLPGKERKLLAVSVQVQGRALRHDYYVQSLPEMDRWLRRAQAVLANPEQARDLKLTAGLVPVKAVTGHWDMKAQVALNLAGLTLLPTAAGHKGGWEIGAVLARLDGEGSWEMLGLSEVRAEDLAASETWVVHERLFTRLAPGSYRLVAFARDRAANVFGGAEAAIRLPRPDRGGIAGPVLMRSARRQIVTTLPMIDQDRRQPESHEASIVIGSIPVGDSPAGTQEALEVSSWSCGRGLAPQPDRLLRYISEEQLPILRFEQISPEPAGECYRITDRIEHWKPRPGSYTYHLRRVKEPQTAGDDASVPFEIASPLDRPAESPRP